ncbi:MAG: hypothetical protein QW613_05265, partial [Thermoprotei archaeon]
MSTLIGFVLTAIMGVSVEPLRELLAAAWEGFTQMFRRHRWGVITVTLLYAILFMYFQQTLLIDGLSYTPSGPFRLHLLPGQWVAVSTTPPVPNMPFPLWGSPFVSLTTNFFDLAFTPLSIGITVSISLLVSSVIFLYLDIYSSTKKGFTSRSSLGLAQTISFLTIFLSCTCEFFEGVLAAIEPAAGIISTTLPSLLSVVDEAFLIFSFMILATSTVYLSARMRGKDATKMLPREYLWFALFTFPFTLFILLGGKSVLGVMVILILAASIVSSRLAHNKMFLVYPAPFFAYIALNGLMEQANPPHNTGILPILLSVLLGVVLSVKTELKRSGILALILSAILSVLVNTLLVVVPIAMLVAHILTGRLSTSLKHYVLYQAVSWAPIMLGPIAVAYRPVPPIPTMSFQSQVELYVYLWLLSTPLSWYLGIKAIFTLMDRAGVATVDFVEEGFGHWFDFSVERVYAIIGVLAITSQALFYLVKPQAFLTSAYDNEIRTLIVTSTSLILVLMGLTLL